MERADEGSGNLTDGVHLVPPSCCENGPGTSVTMTTGLAAAVQMDRRVQVHVGLFLEAYVEWRSVAVTRPIDEKQGGRVSISPDAVGQCVDRRDADSGVRALPWGRSPRRAAFGFHLGHATCRAWGATSSPPHRAGTALRFGEGERWLG